MTRNASAFDEQRVLSELEQLQLAIRESREKRERAQAAFDAQLSEFRPASQRPASAPPNHPPAAPGMAVAVPSETPAAPGLDAVARDAAQPATASAAPATGISRQNRASSSVRAAVGALVVLMLMFGGWMLFRTPADPPSARVEPSRPPAGQPARVDVPAPPASDPHPLRIDIVTLRKVWMRVVVDGRIAIERELPQGERLPFGADKTIVIRAGDAGAVSVRVGTADQGTLGRDGQVVTRTFTVTPH